MGGTEERAPYFSRDEGLTCLYFPLHLGEVDNMRALSSVRVQHSPPTPTSVQESRNRFWSGQETLTGQGTSLI